MALFATMYLDPILRIDKKPITIATNNADKDLFDSYNLVGRSVETLIPNYR